MTTTRPAPDSPAIQRALLPARAAFWRKCGQEAMAARLETEMLAAAIDAALEAEAAKARGETA